MKINKTIYALAFTLAITLASTGCRHQPVGITHIPSTTPPPVPEENNINTMPMPANGQVGENQMPPGTIPTANGWDLSQYNQDRDALAADTIHFAFDSAVIRDDDQPKLQAVAEAMAADPNAKLLIEGNCDERGTEEYNRSLGERRSLAAREALSKLGVDPMRVRTISYGKDKPVDPGHDEQAWAQNRRDDFVLLHPKAAM
jgi:peptidoglycan-associated lipoprotein